MTHDQLQAACWAWAWRTCVTDWPHMLRRFFSVPNSAAGYLGKIKTGQLRACGLLPGVWDMPVYDDVGATHWIEFKIAGDEISADQWKFYYAMHPMGNQFFYEIRDFETFCAIFTAIVENNTGFLQEKRIIPEK